MFMIMIMNIFIFIDIDLDMDIDMDMNTDMDTDMDRDRDRNSGIGIDPLNVINASKTWRGIRHLKTNFCWVSDPREQFLNSNISANLKPNSKKIGYD